MIRLVTYLVFVPMLLVTGICIGVDTLNPESALACLGALFVSPALSALTK